jgi:hypothetical protein
MQQKPLSNEINMVDLAQLVRAPDCGSGGVGSIPIVHPKDNYEITLYNNGAGLAAG